MKLIEIVEVHVGPPGNYNKQEIRRYAVILPLQTGYKDDVIPIPLFWIQVTRLYVFVPSSCDKINCSRFY